MSDVISGVNQKIVGSITNIDWLNLLGWLFAILLLVGAGVWAYIYYQQKRLYKERITAFEEINRFWHPTIRDDAKRMKIGKGGYEILYLKKGKTWKIAYGGKVGQKDYYFFIMPDGYWYNGKLYADLYQIDKHKGLIPVVTTSASMRAQYTSLEKQIDTLNGEQKTFWDKHGSWILGTAFIVIVGFLLYLNYTQYSNAMSGLSGVVEGFKEVANNLARATSSLNIAEQGGTGLIPIK